MNINCFYINNIFFMQYKKIEISSKAWKENGIHIRIKKMKK